MKDETNFNNKEKLLSIRVEDKLKNSLNKIAVEQGVKPSQIARKYIEDGLKKELVGNR